MSDSAGGAGAGGGGGAPDGRATGAGAASFVRVAPSALASQAIIEKVEKDGGSGGGGWPENVDSAAKPALVRRSTHNYEADLSARSGFNTKADDAPAAAPEFARRASFSRDDFKHHIAYNHLMTSTPGDAGGFSEPASK